MESERYTATNIVHSIIFYDWAVPLDIFAVREIFEKIVQLIGTSPDIATVGDFKGGKDYIYPNLAKRQVLEKKKWELLSYLWKRQADSLYAFAIELSCDPESARRFSIHIDEAAVEDVNKTLGAITDFLVEEIKPVYGIGYSIPYRDMPRALEDGQGEPKKPLSGAYQATPEQMSERSYMFRGTFIVNHDKRPLDTRIRDIFKVNFLSEGHLNQIVGDVTFKELIEQRKAGKLKQLNNVTWRWDIAGHEMEKIRDDLINSGINIVTV